MWNVEGPESTSLGDETRISAFHATIAELDGGISPGHHPHVRQSATFIRSYVINVHYNLLTYQVLLFWLIYYEMIL